MISWLDAPIDVTPGAQGAWTDVDNAAVPSGAKGVFLCFENNVTANPPGDKDIGARKNSSTDAWLSKGYWNNSPAGVGTHVYVQAGVDTNGIFEVYIEDTSLSKCWLLGYWENDANVVMLDNAVDKTPTRDDTWRTVSIAADTGADTAVAAIITHYQPDGNYESSGVRKIGSTNTAMYGGHWYNTTIVTLDGSEQFEARVAAGGASKIYLVGYLKGGWVDAESVGPWTDPTVSQAWSSPTLAEKPAGATDEYVAALACCWYGLTANARGLRHRRWSSWDVRRKLSKDGLHWMVIPLDRARKFDDWMYDQPNQYGFIYGYVKRSISAPAGGTALVHLVKEDYTERTTTSTTEVEVTQHTIAWSDLTAAGFAGGDEVILIGKACVGGASTTALQANYRASRGTTFAGRTTWTDSALLHEPNKTTAGNGCSWQWIKKHTLVSSENMYLSLNTNSTTARVDDFVFLVIKLGGAGGLSTDDWRYAETTPSGNASTTYTDGASVTLPGAKNSSWAIFASAHWLIDSTSADLRQKLVVGSDSLCEARYEGENTSEERTYGNLAVAHYIGADTTAKVQYNVDSASTHDCTRTAVFALRLDAFESWTIDSTLLTKTLSALDTYQTLFDTGFQQRDSTARDVIYVGSARSGATGDAAKALYGQIREAANEWPAAGSDRAAYTGAGTSDQLAPWWMGKKTGVAQGNYNLNFRVAEDDDVSPTYTVPEAYFFAFVPRLAATSGGAAQLAGAATGVASATGALSTQILAQAAAVVQAAASGALTTSTPLTGAAAGAATASADLATQVRLVASAIAQASAGGALTNAIRMIGGAIAQAAATGQLATAIQLAGSVAGIGAAGGALATQVVLLANAAGQAAASGNLTASIRLTGAAAAVATAGGALAAPAAQLAGAASAQAIATGALLTQIRLVAGAGSSAVASGALTTAIRLDGAAAAQALASGSLSVPSSLEGAAAAIAQASGDLLTRIALAGTAIAQALASAGLNTTIPLGGAASGVVLASGQLAAGITLNGTAQAQANASGALTAQIRLAGAAAGVAGASGSLQNPIPLAGAATALVLANGTLTAQVRLDGQAVAQAAGAAALATLIRLVGAAQAQAIASGALSVPAGLGGAAQAQATVAAQLLTAIRLAGVAGGTASAFGSLGTGAALAGNAGAAAGALATLTTRIHLAGSAFGLAGGAAELTARIGLDGMALAQAIASGSLTARINLEATAGGQAGAAGALTAGPALLFADERYRVRLRRDFRATGWYRDWRVGA